MRQVEKVAKTSHCLLENGRDKVSMTTNTYTHTHTEPTTRKEL